MGVTNEKLRNLESVKNGLMEAANEMGIALKIIDSKINRIENMIISEHMRLAPLFKAGICACPKCKDQMEGSPDGPWCPRCDPDYPTRFHLENSESHPPYLIEDGPSDLTEGNVEIPDTSDFDPDAQPTDDEFGPPGSEEDPHAKGR